MKSEILLEDGKIIYDIERLSYRFYSDDRLFFEYSPDGVHGDNDPIDEIKKKARIEVTLKCNMACKYCIVYKNFIEQLDTHMTIDNARKVLGEIDAYGTIESLMIIGGEPLVNMDVVKYLCENFKGKKTIFTNGILLTDDLLDFFQRTNSRIMISLDGKREHNTNRCNLGGDAVFDAVIEKINTMKDKGIPFTLNTLVTNDNVDDLYEIVLFFVDGLGANAFGLSYPHFIKGNIGFAADMKYKSYIEQMKRIFLYSKEHGIYVNQIENILKYLLNGKKKKYACKIVGEQITFYPDGKKTLCTKLDTLDKSVDMDTLKKNLPIFKKGGRCGVCIAKNVCGGGCPWDNVLSNGGLDERMCTYNKEMVVYILKDIYQEALKLYNAGIKDIYGGLKNIYSIMLKK